MIKKHNYCYVLISLSKKNDVEIIGNNVFLIKNKNKRTNDLGNKSYGKIDYLVNHCFYIKQYVNDFSNL